MVIKNSKPCAIQQQGSPHKNGHPDVLPMVLNDLAMRAEVGEKKYGVRLQPVNGRDALTDAYQEALDLCMYLRQAIYERDESIVDADLDLRQQVTALERRMAHMESWIAMDLGDSK